jgi:hypothetical protein
VRVRLRSWTAPLREARVCVELPEALAYRGSRPHARLEHGRRCWTLSRLPAHATATRTLTVRFRKSSRRAATIRVVASGSGIRTARASRTIRPD